MAQMDGTGPESKGSATGRGLGHCKSIPQGELGKGQGLQRKGFHGIGKGKRLKSGLNKIEK